MEVPPESAAGFSAASGMTLSADCQEPTAAAELRVVLTLVGKSLLLPLVTVEVPLNSVSHQDGQTRLVIDS